MSGWSHFPHQADMGICGEGNTLAEAFSQAALALTAVIADPECIASRESVVIECEAPDAELLLVDWLNALIYEMATRHMLFSQFDVTITGTRLHAKAHGEAVDAKRHRPTVEVKGASYTALEVGRKNDLWYARCVVDV